MLAGFWQPQPTFSFEGARTFKGGLAIGGRTVIAGDITFQVQLADDSIEYASLDDRTSRTQPAGAEHGFLVRRASEAIDRETVEVFRSKEVLSRKERDAKTAVETALIGEEKLRLRRHQDALRGLLRDALVGGNVFFRGNDRSPSVGATDVAKSIVGILDDVVPDIFDRFKEAAAKPLDVKKGIEALLVAENLQGLPAVFGNLSLLRSENGKVVFRVDEGPLHEVLSRIEQRAAYGETANGKYLADELATEPFGWDFDVVRLLVLSLIRAGSVEATSKGPGIRKHDRVRRQGDIWQ